MMKKHSRYVFGAALASAALGVPGLINKAHAALTTNADFTFENLGGSSASTSITAASVGPFAAEIGTGSAFGVHALATSVYSTPAGNGSAKSFSSNGWAIGDYYQFSVPTTGIQGIILSFDQGSSSTGPHSFNLLYSSDAGGSFQTFGSYAVISSVTSTNSVGSVTTNFSGGTSPNPIFSQLFDLSSITALDNNAGDIFRLVDLVSVASAGTDRIDNVVVAGSAVPEPATLSLLTISAAGLLLRKRSAK
jgi:hypothetical protein